VSIILVYELGITQTAAIKDNVEMINDKIKFFNPQPNSQTLLALKFIDNIVSFDRFILTNSCKDLFLESQKTLFV